MKALKINNLLAIVMLLAGTTIFSTSCDKDPCEDVVCQNGGIEVEVNDDTCECDCAAGYEGELCETLSRAKFVGTYSVVDACTPSGSATYTVTATAGSTDDQRVLLDGVWELFTNPIIATVDGNTITIANQEPDNDDYTISGTGTYSNGVITLTYSVTDPDGDVDNCNSTMTKQ